MANVRTVLFDLDDTICTYRRDVDDVLAEAFHRAGVAPYFDAADWGQVIPTIERADSQASFRRTCFRQLAREHDRDPIHARAVADAYGEIRDPRDVELLPGARTAIDTLARTHRLGLVTNAAPEIQRPKLSALGLTSTFDATVFAGTETVAKPDPSPFEMALDRLDAMAATTVHVGNCPDADVTGAKRAGLQAVWVPDEPRATVSTSHHADHTLQSLHDLPAALGRGT